MFNIPEKKYKIYPISLYLLRDLLLYALIIGLMFVLNTMNENFNNILFTILFSILGFGLGSLLMINFHEWAHYLGIILGRSKATMLPITSLTRLFYYEFSSNSRKQNLTMMVSGLLFNTIIYLPLMLWLPDTPVFIALKSGATLWMFEIILIELYIGMPRYLGKMNYYQCYKRHTPHRKRNLYISLLAALPFVVGYLSLVLTT